MDTQSRLRTAASVLAKTCEVAQQKANVMAAAIQGIKKSAEHFQSVVDEAYEQGLMAMVNSPDPDHDGDDDEAPEGGEATAGSGTDANSDDDRKVAAAGFCGSNDWAISEADGETADDRHGGSDDNGLRPLKRQKRQEYPWAERAGSSSRGHEQQFGADMQEQRFGPDTTPAYRSGWAPLNFVSPPKSILLGKCFAITWHAEK